MFLTCFGKFKAKYNNLIWGWNNPVYISNLVFSILSMFLLFIHECKMYDRFHESWEVFKIKKCKEFFMLIIFFLRMTILLRSNPLIFFILHAHAVYSKVLVITAQKRFWYVCYIKNKIYIKYYRIYFFVVFNRCLW